MKELTEKELTHHSKFKVTSAETDMFSRICLGSYVNLLIQSAIQSADDLGFGFRGLEKQQLFWVLSRLTFEIYRPLRWYEDVEVETWPKDVERIIYLRDFLVRDAQQHIVARATSGWLAVDMESKRPKKLEGVNARMFEHLGDKHALAASPEKLPPAREGESYEVKSSYYDIDLNKHVTSTRYIDWMMDGFDPDFHRIHYPRRLSVNYMKETLPLETIRLLRHEPEDRQHYFEGVNLGANTTAFRGLLEF